MKKKIFVLLFLPWLMSSCDVAESLIKVVEEEAPLTQQEVTRGLKEALRVSADTAVNIVSTVNGFYGDQLIKIYLPPEAKIIMDNKDNPLLKAVGITKLVDDAILGMNRAAENAAKSATPIFVNAIKSMTINDAFAILNGSDTAATQYFRSKTYSQLKNSFKPKVKSSLGKPLVGNISPNQAWTSLTSSYNDVAVFTGWNKVNTQLDEYVTNKALSGLFLKLKEEERQIRKDPKARVTDILERVFGENIFK
ncbi:MAG: DUF4197 domain-containing protein [Bacteroidales bacterium]|nr:DUF4197 domain-containing protein [Bacteroidales bacterium]MCF8405572.1 DUF4197 domain-containing protein [Bacteroidales bacterium]